MPFEFIYIEARHIPITDVHIAPICLIVIFSLNANIAPIHTAIIPVPLNNGNITADGTLPAIFVITRLITHKETELPKAYKIILLFLSVFLT